MFNIFCLRMKKILRKPCTIKGISKSSIAILIWHFASYHRGTCEDNGNSFNCSFIESQEKIWSNFILATFSENNFEKPETPQILLVPAFQIQIYYFLGSTFALSFQSSGLSQYHGRGWSYIGLIISPI